MSPPPPGPRRSLGTPAAPDPGRRSSPPGQRSHKEPGREGDEISRCPIPLFPREKQPSTVRPSLLFANHFILLLFEAVACFFIPLFIFPQSAAARLPLIPGSPRSVLPAQALRIPADSPPSLSLSPSAPLRCSPRSQLLSPPSFNFTETPVKARAAASRGWDLKQPRRNPEGSGALLWIRTRYFGGARSCFPPPLLPPPHLFSTLIQVVFRLFEWLVQGGLFFFFLVSGEDKAPRRTL